MRVLEQPGARWGRCGRAGRSGGGRGGRGGGGSGRTGGRRAGRQMVSASERERRVRAVAPLFRYLAEHGVSASWLGRQVAERLEIEIGRQRVSDIKSGEGTCPRGFMPTACAVLGFADPVALFGAEWIAEFGWEYDCAPFPGLKGFAAA